MHNKSPRSSIMPSTRSLVYAALGATLSFAGVQAQAGTAADVPLDIDGAFQTATLTGTEFNSGGSITCNGRTVIVPKNLQITFPAAFVGFKDFVANMGSYKGYQCSITGNVVGGKAIAAQIAIAQFATTTNSGYITKVDFGGDITVNAAGQALTIRINDPRGVYSVGNDKAGFTIDPAFTADDANPSITSFSGFPMCVPRSATDPLCPMTNRPGLKQGSILAADSKVMAPLIAGDFITFSGYESGGKIIVYNLVASNIQITTTGVPTYIRMEDANIGVWTADTANQEIAQTRFVGYTSDSDAKVNPISISAIEYDPCTGVPSYREVAKISVPSTEARNKFEYRNKATLNDVYAREYRIVAGNGIFNTNNNIQAGSYVMPVSEWIQPEDSTPGLPPAPHDFRSYGWLVKGLGRDADGNLWGPLDPFPQSNVAIYDNSKCPPATPATPVTSPVASPGTGNGGSAASPSPAAPTPKVYPDVVTFTGFNWASSQSGTLTAQCTSNNTNDAAVAMKLTYTNKDGTTVGLPMISAGKGVWNFLSNKIKQPTEVICKSGLGGSAKR
ncbi:uncharacterized protein CTRU02_204375 [Colletotrichum truncatum]|uniref:Uncharacterized protein n=1 Tax=Colletotrichum truncatum TaxID=5467 RepID=A0ACC3ZBW0_COLTU|nr:uncharacterized protein CTRU02_13095 [Colletotrichum truncatum]KAF6783845.1 hypothetical protein CTRU02_13095 [Colletotrichum truncatum]